jgi:hypothetical protein
MASTSRRTAALQPHTGMDVSLFYLRPASERGRYSAEHVGTGRGVSPVTGGMRLTVRSNDRSGSHHGVRPQGTGPARRLAGTVGRRRRLVGSVRPNSNETVLRPNELSFRAATAHATPRQGTRTRAAALCSPGSRSSVVQVEWSILLLLTSTV